MKTKSNVCFFLFIILGVFSIMNNGCEKDEDKICIDVDGYYITIKNLYSDGHEVVLNAYGYSFFEADYDHDGNVHHIVYSNFTFDNSSVTGVNIVIDDKNYNYPKNKC